MSSYLAPQWPVPKNVKALVTTRQGGSSTGPYGSFNLGDHVGDDPHAVASNRAKLHSDHRLPAPIIWLNQIHSDRVLMLDEDPPADNRADAAVSRASGRPCAVLTADCLPVLLCDRRGEVVAAAHAGWRGLAGGILRTTVAAMERPGAELMAWLGPAISAAHFEVGDEVRRAFLASARNDLHRTAVEHCFAPVAEGKSMADLYGLARAELNSLGVTEVHGGEYCTYGQPGLFYSYRRDGATGRMASLIWRES